MEPRDDLIRAIAIQLASVREFGRQVPNERTAQRHFFEAAFPHRRCPACGAPRLQHEGRRIRCHSCRLNVSLTALTPLRNTKLPLRIWLAAVWHLHVAPQSISSRAFAHRYALRVMTAWDLLGRTRAAFPRLSASSEGAVRQTLGRQRRRNRALISLASEDGRITALPVEEVPAATRRQQAQDRLHAAHFHAWTVATFRGVRRTHQWRYLAEWADRQRRRYVGMPASSRRPAT
jgi:transposase-like protein